jgi:membrane protease YdiL (CAAX protease family)
MALSFALKMTQDIQEALEIESPRRYWGPWATAGFGAVVIIISLVVQTVVSIVILLASMFSQLGASGILNTGDIIAAVEEAFQATGGLITSVSTFASAAVCIGLVLIIVKARGGAGFKEYLAIGPVSVKALLISLAVVAGFMALSETINVFLDRPVPEFMIDIYDTSVWPVMLWLAIVVFAPLYEEIFFRGFLFTGFLQSRLGPVGAVVLTALAWSLLHVQYDIYDIASIFVLGLVLGVMRLRTGSVWSPLLMHVLNNLVAMVMMAVGVGIE